MPVLRVRTVQQKARQMRPSQYIAEKYRVMLNRLLHDTWQDGYQQALKDTAPPPQTEAGIQHDGPACGYPQKSCACLKENRPCDCF